MRADRTHERCAGQCPSHSLCLARFLAALQAAGFLPSATQGGGWRLALGYGLSALQAEEHEDSRWIPVFRASASRDRSSPLAALPSTSASGDQNEPPLTLLNTSI